MAKREIYPEGIRMVVDGEPLSDEANEEMLDYMEALAQVRIAQDRAIWLMGKAYGLPEFPLDEEED